MLLKAFSTLALVAAVSAIGTSAGLPNAGFASSLLPYAEPSSSNVVSYAPPQTPFFARTDFVDTNAFSGNDAEFADFATAKVTEFLGDKDITFTHSHTSEGIHYSYFTQMYKNLPIANLVGNSAVRADGEFSAFSSNFAETFSTVYDKVNLDAKKAFLAAAKKLNINAKGKLQVTPFGDSAFTINGAKGVQGNVAMTKKYYALPGDKLALVYDMNFQVRGSDAWYNAYVSAETGNIVALHDWTHYYEVVPDASYNVIPVNKVFRGQQPQLLTNPHNLVASPNGWHNAGASTTTGNNVKAHKGGVVSQATNYNFDFKFDTSKQPEAMVDFAVTELFYINNAIHDILYNYGFTEKAANFQNDNFGKGGSGNDAVDASAQDASGTNNANFATPPDGQAGRMRMYIFDITNPKRDGTIDTNIISHEYGHGVSNRLVGGGNNVNCLSSTESGGLGEGWSDILAYILETDPTQKRNDIVAPGGYTLNRPTVGVRQYPYTSDKTLNPFKYSNAKGQAVHAAGSVWATINHEVMFNLIEKLGHSDIQDPTGTGGNVHMMKLYLNGLKKTPCKPTFINARDAIIAADKDLGGLHQCEIWKGFASRGMGAKADSFTDDSSLPIGVCDGPVTSKTTTTASTTTNTPLPTETTTTNTKTTTTNTPLPTETTTTNTMNSSTTTTTSKEGTTTSVTKTKSTKTVSTKTVSTKTTTVGGKVSNGGSCSIFGAWACNYSCQCSYGASSQLVWFCQNGASC